MKTTAIKLAGQWFGPALKSILPAGVLLLCALNAPVAAQSSDDVREPELPVGCESVEVPAGNKVSFRVYAIGVQIYSWNGTAWVFVAPDAVLYANANYDGEVGIHYGGPTWESASGSKVVSRRVAGCTPDASSIPWLRLETVSTEGAGIFSDVTFIQRVNTIGGLAPTLPGASVGEQQHVPYTAEYVFYRASTE